MEPSRVEEIRAEVVRQRKRWNEMLKGFVMEPVTCVVNGPVFRPHISEAELEELLGLVEKNRELEERLAQTFEVKVYAVSPHEE